MRNCALVEPRDELTQFVLTFPRCCFVATVEHTSDIRREFNVATKKEHHVLTPKATPEPAILQGHVLSGSRSERCPYCPIVKVDYGTAFIVGSDHDYSSVCLQGKTFELSGNRLADD